MKFFLFRSTPNKRVALLGPLHSPGTSTSTLVGDTEPGERSVGRGPRGHGCVSGTGQLLRTPYGNRKVSDVNDDIPNTFKWISIFSVIRVIERNYKTQDSKRVKCSNETTIRSTLKPSFGFSDTHKRPVKDEILSPVYVFYL